MTKKEAQPYKQKFNELFKQIRQHFLDDFSLSYRLVGSSKRNLVINHHNKGFDLDYQIIIQKNKGNYDPKKINELFFNYIKKILGNEYQMENSTSAITLKKVLQNDSKIEQGYDIVIIEENNTSAKILRRYDDINDLYDFLPLRNYDHFKHDLKIIKQEKLWQKLRDEYLKQKVASLTDPNSKSFFILINCANKVVSQFF